MQTAASGPIAVAAMASITDIRLGPDLSIKNYTNCKGWVEGVWQMTASVDDTAAADIYDPKIKRSDVVTEESG